MESERRSLSRIQFVIEPKSTPHHTEQHRHRNRTKNKKLPYMNTSVIGKDDAKHTAFHIKLPRLKC